MFGFQSFKVNPKKILSLLHDFEGFCLGEKKLSPEEFKEINEELSLGAMVYVGRCRLQKKAGGVHMIWLSPDNFEHDLGPVDKINVMKDCPGFHRMRSLSLGHDQVEENALIDVPPYQRQISVVKMKDGSMGYGPNYKIALRNAALKMHLKQQFSSANPKGSWKDGFGNA